MPSKKKPEVNPKALAKANNAFAIAAEVEAIVESIVEAGGECDETQLANLQSWKAALEVKAQSIGFVKMRLDSEIEMFKVMEDSAKSRRKSRENAVKRLKDYLADCMGTADVKSIKQNDGLFSMSLVDGKASVEITDESKLPLSYVDVIEVVKPKTKEIKEALESGKSIPGARLVYGKPYVTIRSK